MHIADAADCLAWEARRVEVIDIAVLRVEQIEDFERQPHAFSDLAAAPWLADCAMPTTLSAGRSASARFVNVDFPVTITSALRAR